MTKLLEPITLGGNLVTLVPLSSGHQAALEKAVEDGALWDLWYTNAPKPAGVAAEIERRLALQAAGSMLPFTVLQPGTDRVVGVTSLMHIDAENRRLEIGSTWYAQSVQRTGLNTDAKRLLLEYAFEGLNCLAVELRTHFMNHQSRRAIEKLGAKLDGVLRAHSIMPNGTVRDTCVYSIVAAEWPAVRANLEWQLRKPR